jgi:chemotaxis protein methyltransferase CheR
MSDPYAHGGTETATENAGTPVTEAHRLALQRVLRQRTGIVLQSYQQDNLDGILSDACRRFGHGTVEDYLTALEGSTSTAPEMEYLIARVTVGESYFFRDDEQLRFLRTQWLPRLIAEKERTGNRTLRIWSAGCSAGQEIYTVAMLLHEALERPADWSLHLLGTDINTAALSMAIRGRYTPWSLRSTTEEYRQRYFVQDGDQYAIAPELRGLVKFFYLNLLEDNFPTMLTGTNAMDLILCRNVFIYLDPDMLPPVMEKFQASLVPGGCLLLGASDLAARPSQGLQMEQWGNTFCFRRTDGLPPQTPHVPAPTATAPREPTKRVQAVERKEAAPEQPPRSSKAKHQDVIQLLREERWNDVVETVDAHVAREGDDAELAQHKAKALANLGALEEAAKASERSIEMAPLDKHTYLIKALVMIELNDLGRAEEALRRAIFLDASFVEAHFQLGLLQLRAGDRRAGMRSLSNALDLAEKLDPERNVHNAPGMVFGRLADILRKEMNVYQGED